MVWTWRFLFGISYSQMQAGAGVRRRLHPAGHSAELPHARVWCLGAPSTMWPLSSEVAWICSMTLRAPRDGKGSCQSLQGQGPVLAQCHSYHALLFRAVTGQPRFWGVEDYIPPPRGRVARAYGKGWHRWQPSRESSYQRSLLKMFSSLVWYSFKLVKWLKEMSVRKNSC